MSHLSHGNPFLRAARHLTRRQRHASVQVERVCDCVLRAPKYVLQDGCVQLRIAPSQVLDLTPFNAQVQWI